MAARLSQSQLQRSYVLSPAVVHWPDLHGVSSTSVLVSHYKRRGDYRVHAAVSSSSTFPSTTSTVCFTFNKGCRDRHEEDAAAAALTVAALHRGAGKGRGEGADLSEGVYEEPHDWVNAVGERAVATGEGETVPKVERFGEEGGGGEEKWRVEVGMGVGDWRVVEAPDFLLPEGSVVFFPRLSSSSSSSHSSPSSSAATYTALLASLNHHRDGELGKSWTRHQPTTLILSRSATSTADLRESGVLLCPDQKRGGGEEEEGPAFENWGILEAPSGTEGGGVTVAATVGKYRDAGATFCLSAADFFEVARNKRLAMAVVEGGGKFAIDCAEGGLLTAGMLRLAKELGREDFFELVGATVLLDPGETARSGGGYTDGSPSTSGGGVGSVRAGDDVESGYVQVDWENGITYRGFVNGGKFDGLGAKIYSRGGGYEGMWKEGKREGEGVSLYGGKWGYEKWEGSFENDVPEGEGLMERVDGGMETFRFEKGEPVNEAI